MKNFLKYHMRAKPFDLNDPGANSPNKKKCVFIFIFIFFGYSVIKSRKEVGKGHDFC